MRDTILELRDFYSRHGFYSGGAIAGDESGEAVKFDSLRAKSFDFYGAIGRMMLADSKALPHDYDLVMERRAQRQSDLEAGIRRYMSERMGCSYDVISCYDAIIVSFQNDMIGDDREALDRFFDFFDEQPVLADAAD